MRHNDSRTWKVASYARLSREDGEPNESQSIAGQKAIIEDWAARCGHAEIVASYVDDGYSGASFERPGFKEMLADARAGLFDTIAVKDLSRFGRSYLDCGVLIEREFPQMGIRLFSVTDSFDSMQSWDCNMALLVPMKNLMNEMQVVTTSEKTRMSLEAKRKRGEFVGNFAPYGYKKDPLDRHRLVVDEAAAAIVRRIFAMRLSGESASCIARRLTMEHIASPGAYRMRDAENAPMKWHAKTVLHILRDETYTGTLVQGKTKRINWRSRVSVPVPSDEWVRHAESHEAIVGKSLFGEVQELLSH